MEKIDKKECKNKCEKYDKPVFYEICEICDNLFCNNCMYLICVICHKQYVCFHCGSQERNRSFLTGNNYIIRCNAHLNSSEEKCEVNGCKICSSRLK